MASTLTYYQVRKEIPGIYIVALRFELKPYEKATVNVGRYRDRGYDCRQYHSGTWSCGLQTETRCYPKNPLEVESLTVHEYNEIGNFWINDTITIEVKDMRLEEMGGGPYQIVSIVATMDGMEMKSLPCKLHDRTWKPIILSEILVKEGGEYKSSYIPPSMKEVSQPSVDSQELASDMETCQKLYPYVTQAQIVTAMNYFIDALGNLDVIKMNKSLSKSNIKAQKKAETESLAVRQVESIIESKM